MKTFAITGLASALMLGAGAALAGGFVPPVVEATPIVVVAEPVGAWQGGYAGLTLGYAFNGKDRVGVTDTADGSFLGNIGEMKLGGANAGVRLGYRLQRDRWVFGPELGYEGGSIKDDTKGDIAGVSHDAESKIKSVLALRLKTGYLAKPDTLVYGILGFARADVDYRVDGFKDSYKADGYVAGFGVEKQLNEKWSITGEYEYASFDKKKMPFGDITSEATPKYNNIKVGANFRF